ncbi:MAG: N-6 DNA methylase [Planctomycetaceae bacterium]|nr:N-6 DNA methylase [Planctomycetaceae bacterium]
MKSRKTAPGDGVTTSLADRAKLAFLELAREFQGADDPNLPCEELRTAVLRLVFLLFAEDRGLMNDSVTKLFDKLSCDSETTRNPRYEAWPKLLALLRFMPGGPFPFLEKEKISDDTVYRALKNLRFSYRTLDVEQLGGVYETLLESDKRRHGGAYYTPRLLTQQIVRQTLAPVLAAFGDNIRPENILNLKICDPSMGSGAFLLECCRQLGDLLVDSWHKNDCVPETDDEVSLARQRVAQHCLHGVDIDPMATELARLSLWLFARAKDQPLAFLDPYLQCGDSLLEMTPRQNGMFDAVVGNPPYIPLQKYKGELANIYEPYGYQTFVRTGNVYCLFYELGFRLLKPDGVLGLITSNKWMRAGYGERMRTFLDENMSTLHLTNLAGARVFEGVTVDSNIFIAQKRKPLPASPLSISPLDRIRKKIEAVGTPLAEWNLSIHYGVKTGCNEAFIIDGARRNTLVAADPGSAEILVPVLRGRDIKRYGYEFADLWLINTHNGVKSKGIKPVDVEEYPAIKKHLDSYFPQLEKRADQGNTPYHLRDCAYLEKFSAQKLLYPETTQTACFALEEGKMFIDKTCFMLISENAKYLQATLSSKLFEFAYKAIYSSIVLGTKGYQYNKHALLKLPVLLPSAEIERKMEAMLERKEYDKIDLLIYELYGLGEEEIGN